MVFVNCVPYTVRYYCMFILLSPPPGYFWQTWNVSPASNVQMATPYAEASQIVSKPASGVMSAAVEVKPIGRTELPVVIAFSCSIVFHYFMRLHWIC